MRPYGLAVGFVLMACGAPSSTGVNDSGAVAQIDAGVVDAGLKSDACASTFGTSFTAAFGRIDGRVVAVVPPGFACPLPNGDHVVIQVAIDGGVHRLVVNVLSSGVDKNIQVLTRPLGALPAPAYEEGWHPGLTLDYANTLGVHSDRDAGWESLDLEHAAAQVYDAVTVGAPLSVYGTSSGGSSASSAHLIHRHEHNDDGAIVVNPTSASPTWLLFHFAEQRF